MEDLIIPFLLDVRAYIAGQWATHYFKSETNNDLLFQRYLWMSLAKAPQAEQRCTAVAVSVEK